MFSLYLWTSFKFRFSVCIEFDAAIYAYPILIQNNQPLQFNEERKQVFNTCIGSNVANTNELSVVESSGWKPKLLDYPHTKKAELKKKQINLNRIF